MTHYFDITILSDPEISIHILMSELFNKLHVILAHMESDNIGISFPDYQKRPPNIGAKIRLLGPKDLLVKLQNQSWLGAIRNHTVTQEISLIPDNVEYRFLRRVQIKNNPERLRRRQMIRHNLTEQEAILKIPNIEPKRLKLPFIQLKSNSTKQRFFLFLDLTSAQHSIEQGTFNKYGLSNTRTIPWF